MEQEKILAQQLVEQLLIVVQATVGTTDISTGPTLYVSKGGLESIHFINEDYDTHSKHNFNIDEFKVHSKDLGYFQSQIITFIVNKDGMFEYYCSIHPEMRGKLVVT